MKRIFIAIKIFDFPELKNVNEFVKNSLKIEKIKWVEMWNLHLTLVFLGDTNDKKIDEIKTELDNLTSKFQQFKLTIRSVGVFKNLENPHIIWFGIDPNLFLEEIKKEVDFKLSKIDIHQEIKKFKPHLTIGRAKNIIDKSILKDVVDQLQGKEILVQQVDNIILYESKLTNEGPIYNIIHTSQLKSN